jgi:hypothetical protein
MNNSIKPFLYNSYYLLKENIELLLIPIVLTFSPYLFYFSANYSLGTLSSSISRLGLIVIYPLMYGKFVAIIYGNNTITWGQLFALHWWNFILVSIVLNSPVLLISIIDAIITVKMHFLISLISLLINILSIYIIPIVFIENQRMPSIPLGLKCLLGNLKFSLPLILINISPIILSLLPIKNVSSSEVTLSYLLLALPMFIFTLFIDFMVFITATLILKANLYRN